MTLLRALAPVPPEVIEGMRRVVIEDVEARTAERSRFLEQQREIRIRLERPRRFIEAGDSSAKVRERLAEAEREEAGIRAGLARLAIQDGRPCRSIPEKAPAYLRDLHATLAKGGTRARELLPQDVERIVVHPVRSETAKPFARAEIVATGKGLLERAALVVAGAGFAQCYTVPTTYRVDLAGDRPTSRRSNRIRTVVS